MSGFVFFFFFFLGKKSDWLGCFFNYSNSFFFFPFSFVDGTGDSSPITPNPLIFWLLLRWVVVDNTEKPVTRRRKKDLETKNQLHIQFCFCLFFIICHVFSNPVYFFFFSIHFSFSQRKLNNWWFKSFSFTSGRRYIRTII